MIQKIGTCETLSQFLNKIEGLEIDGIAVVVLHGNDYASYQFNMDSGDLTSSASLLERYAQGDLSHHTEN